MKTLKFLKEVCTLEVKKYVGGEIAIQLYCPDGPMARATVAIEKKPERGQLFIKDYSENEGMAKAFEEAGLAKEVGRISAGRADNGVSIMEITDPELLNACYPKMGKEMAKGKAPVKPKAEDIELEP